MWGRKIASILLALAAPSMGIAQEQSPLSAIDWLSQSVREPASTPAPIPDHNAGTKHNDETPVASKVNTPSVQVMALDDDTGQEIGSRLPLDLGLQAALWQGANADILSQIKDLPRDPLPAIRDLIRKLMIARTAPPAGVTPEQFALARTDYLLEIGALDDAQTLLENAGLSNPAYFRRYFDIALITGREDTACKVMDKNPTVAPTFAARIFCLARGGDWSAASLTLYTGHALGDISSEDEKLLAIFLDHELFEAAALPDIPQPPSPLHIRLFEAIGAPQPHGQMPRAYLHSDLRPRMGWKAQIEAAEALAAHGVLSPERLIQIYSRGRASASGGVWERVKAAQAVESALANQTTSEDLPQVLKHAWTLASHAQLQVPMATLWAPRLGALPTDALSPDLKNIVRDITLLSDHYHKEIATDAALAALAETLDPRLGPVIADAFLQAPIAPPEGIAQGAALLDAIADIEAGRVENPKRLVRGLRALRGMGMNTHATSAALQILLVDPA